MAGENSGMAILLKAMGVDPKAIMESIAGFGALAEQVQLTVTTIEAQLTNIQETQALILKQLAGLQFQMTELVLAKSGGFVPQALPMDTDPLTLESYKND